MSSTIGGVALLAPHPLSAQDTRIAELIQVFFAGQLSDEQALVLFERLAAGARAAPAAYDQIPQPPEADVQATGPQRERFFWQLTLDYGIMSTSRDLEWVESAIALIKGGQLSVRRTWALLILAPLRIARL